MQRKMRKGSRRGYALISSLIAVLVLLIAGSSLFTTADTGSRLAHRRLASAQALELAMSAADCAKLSLQHSESYTGFNSRAFGSGTFSAVIVPVSGEPEWREITGSGTVPLRNGSVTKRVRITVNPRVLPPALSYPLIVDRTLSLNGDVSILPSSLGGTTSVHSNGDANLSGSGILIDGKVTASGNVRISGTPQISGGTTGQVAKVPFPPVDEAFKDQASADGGTVGNVTASDGRLLAGVIQGNLKISTPNGCRLNGVVWVRGSVDVSGPVTGRGTIVSDTTMNLNASQNLSVADTSSLLFIALSPSPNAVQVSGSNSFKGIIYAPNGGVRANGNPTIFGGIAAQTVSFPGTPKIVGWDGFFQTPPPAPGGFKILGWQELRPS